jgi:hypothetical protein
MLVLMFVGKVGMSGFHFLVQLAGEDEIVEAL